LDAVKALAIEHRRRAHWRQRESSASSFAAEYGHADDASLPDPAPDQMRLSATSWIGRHGGGNRPDDLEGPRRATSSGPFFWAYS
jgi:hypothetical protein